MTHGVAAHITCPVYAVPDDWHELRDHPDPVMAAVEDPESGRAVTATAFAEARRAGSALRVVRAWCYPEIDTDEESLRHGSGSENTAAIRQATIEALADLTARYRDVPCQVDVVHGQAAYTLVEASRHSRLLVIGRHRPTHPWGSHLGPVTRSVLTTRAPRAQTFVSSSTGPVYPSSPPSRRVDSATGTDGSREHEVLSTLAA